MKLLAAARQSLTWGLLGIAASSCGNYSRQLGYGSLPPAARFSLYDPHFAASQAVALASSKLSIGYLYFSKFLLVAPAAEHQHPHRRMLAHFNWGPFYSPAASDTLGYSSRLVLYTYLKFYADAGIPRRWAKLLAEYSAPPK